MSDRADLGEAAVAVLQTGLADWVSLADLDAVARFYASDESGCASLIEVTVRELVTAGLVRIGGLTRDGFSAFEVGQERAIGVVLGEYRSQSPAWPFNAWLDNTAEGDAVARAHALARYLVADD